jgi:hypothetical protein
LGWTRHVDIIPPHNFQIEGYLKTAGGYRRSFGIKPSASGSCLTGVGIDYTKIVTPLPLTPKPASIPGDTQ